VRRLLARRFLQALIVVVGVVVVTFGVARLVPGDPAVAYAGPRASRAQLEQVHRQLHLDAAWPVQLVDYGRDLLRGDLGTSLHTRRPVADDLATAVPASLELVIVALIAATALGVPLGIVAARQRGRVLDGAIRLLSTLSVSMPVFWLGLILQNVFFHRLGWLPVAGEYTASLDYSSPLTVYTHLTIVDAALGGNLPVLESALGHVILPAAVVAAYPLGAARVICATAPSG